MGYRAFTSRNTVLTKYTGCSTRWGVLVLLAPSGGWGASRDNGAPSG